jgi:hypothetical protein
MVLRRLQKQRQRLKLICNFLLSFLLVNYLICSLLMCQFRMLTRQRCSIVICIIFHSTDKSCNLRLFICCMTLPNNLSLLLDCLLCYFHRLIRRFCIEGTLLVSNTRHGTCLLYSLTWLLKEDMLL